MNVSTAERPWSPAFRSGIIEAIHAFAGRGEGEVVSVHDLLEMAICDGHHFGMNTMNQSLERLYQAKQISCEDALANAGNLTELRHMLRRS